MFISRGPLFQVYNIVNFDDVTVLLIFSNINTKCEKNNKNTNDVRLEGMYVQFKRSVCSVVFKDLLPLVNTHKCSKEKEMII